MSEPVRWQVLFKQRAEKVLRRIPRDVRERIDRKILDLANNPRSEGCRKLVGFDNIYRIRVGDWRIIYSIENDKLIVLIMEIAPRGVAYRK